VIDELLAQFLVEGREQTLEAGVELTALHRGANDSARLERCFRAVHTLKGSADLLGLRPMGRMLHVAEDLLGALRQGEDGASRYPALLEAIDQVDRWLDALEVGGALPDDAEAVADRLIGQLGAEGGARTTPTAASDWDGGTAFAGRTGVAIRYTPHADSYFSGDDPLALIAAVPGLADLRVSLAEPVADPVLYDPFRCNLVIEALSTAALSQVEAALRLVRDQIALATIAPSAVVEAEPARRTVRVDAERIDHLAELADQLVVAKGGLAELADQVERLAGGQALGPALRARRLELDRLVESLHATVGQARMTPLAPLFGRFPRVVRETAAALGKTVSLEVAGGEVEVDKAVVDGLFEPLLHVLRNAADHGVETAEVRVAAGKSAEAAIRLSARTEGDQIVLEVADDGAGVDPARVRARAVARGLIATDAEMSEGEIVDLIFRPGFSTRDTVSAVSGRGVGMDAVRAGVTRLGGQVEVQSRASVGTTVRMTLPIRTVLAKLMVVACGTERFGLPLESVVEVARVEARNLIPVRAGQAFVLRDQVVPLVDLAEALGGAVTPARSGPRRVVVGWANGELVGFAVDAVLSRTDAVVRPMTGLLAGARGVVGSTLDADGAVLLVLDLAELLT
jgi:two-component system chemotaxis sensor kinase CheA